MLFRLVYQKKKNESGMYGQSMTSVRRPGPCRTIRYLNKNKGIIRNKQETQYSLSQHAHAIILVSVHTHISMPRQNTQMRES